MMPYICMGIMHGIMPGNHVKPHMTEAADVRRMIIKFGVSEGKFIWT